MDPLLVATQLLADSLSRLRSKMFSEIKIIKVLICLELLSFKRSSLKINMYPGFFFSASRQLGELHFYSVPPKKFPKKVKCDSTIFRDMFCLGSGPGSRLRSKKALLHSAMLRFMEVASGVVFLLQNCLFMILVYFHHYQHCCCFPENDFNLKVVDLSRPDSSLCRQHLLPCNP